MKTTTSQLCSGVFFASNTKFPVYLNSVENKIGVCELNENNTLDITYETDFNLIGSKYAYLVAQNKDGLHQSDFYGLLIIN